MKIAGQEIDDKTSYYIKQADIAHELYVKSKGGYKNEWKGAAIGFKRVLSNQALFKECLSKADKILQAD